MCHYSATFNGNFKWFGWFLVGWEHFLRVTLSSPIFFKNRFSSRPSWFYSFCAAKTNKNIEFCKLCKETFANKTCLIDHMKASHAETRHFCNLCERSYAQESNLAMHIESKHEGKRYDCNDCDFQSTRKSVLDIHIRFHHKGIGFDCFKCGKKYAHFNGLKIHNIKHHSMK